MPKYKRNHFVGRAVIAFWADPQGRVIYWERDKDGVLVSRNPKSVHYIDNLYARWEADGSRDMTAEHHLQREIDDHAPDFVRSVIQQVNDQNAISLSEDERSFLARWMLRTVLRSPMIVTLLHGLPQVKLARELFALSRQFGLNGAIDVAVDRYGEQRVIDGEVVSLASTIDIKANVEEIVKCGFHFCIPVDGARNFILGSQPNVIKPGHAGEGPDDAPSPNQLFLVLHPRIVVGTSFVPCPDLIIPFEDEDVQRVNGLFLKYCGSVVMHSTRDVDGAWHKPFGGEDSDEIVEFKLGPRGSSDEA